MGFGDLFKKETPREKAKAAQKETKQTVRSNQRSMDRDIRDLDRQEKLLLQQIKARAKTAGVNPATDTALKAQAKQLVQLRNQKAKLYLRRLFHRPKCMNVLSYRTTYLHG